MGRPPPRATRCLPLRSHCSAWPLASNTRAPEPLPPGWRHPRRTRFCGNRAPCSLRLFMRRPPGCGLGAPGRWGLGPRQAPSEGNQRAQGFIQSPTHPGQRHRPGGRFRGSSVSPKPQCPLRPRRAGKVCRVHRACQAAGKTLKDARN